MMNDKKYSIFQSLVGTVTEAEFKNISKNVEMYMYDDLSIFIPCIDYCDYAITPQHRHPSYSFIYNYSGQGEIRVYGTVRSSSFGNKPNICAFSPGIPHEEIVQDQFKSYMAVCISKKFYEQELKSYTDLKEKIFVGDFFEANDVILHALQRFIIESMSSLPCTSRILDAITLEITHLMIRHCYCISQASAKISQKIEINQLINYLNENYSKKVTVEEMAKIVNLSSSHFARIFKEETGSSPIDFLINLKLQKAKRFLLQKKHSITEIAYACGFSSSSHFSNCFVERTGMAPSDFRKKQSVLY